MAIVSLLLLLLAGIVIVIVVGILAYVIARQIDRNSNEDFERRDN